MEHAIKSHARASHAPCPPLPVFIPFPINWIPIGTETRKFPCTEPPNYSLTGHLYLPSSLICRDSLFQADNPAHPAETDYIPNPFGQDPYTFAIAAISGKVQFIKINSTIGAPIVFHKIPPISIIAYNRPALTTRSVNPL
jgi:hypothetical protein